MLQIKDFTISHKKDDRLLVDHFSLVLNDGDKAVMIGEEGNGKSTLLKAMADEALVDSYADVSGEVIRNQTRIGYLPQELPMADKGKSIYEYMCESSCFLELTPAELADIARQLGLSLEDFYQEQLMGSLSGGEKIKIQFARLLCEKPSAFFLDEPSNDIDIRTLEWLEGFIQRTMFPVLFISHDETLIERTANMVIHMELLRRKTVPRITVAKMSYRDYVDKRLSSMATQEQRAKKEKSDYEKQQEKFRQIQQKVEHQQNVISRGDPRGGALLKKTMHRVKAYEARFNKEHENMTQMPESEEAIFFKMGAKEPLPNGKTVLDFHLDTLKVGEQVLAEPVDLLVRGPEKICIIGNNGCGKTTLMRLIATRMLDRTDLQVSYMPQNYEELLDMDQNPVDFLCQVGDKEEISRIRTYLGSLKYTADEMDHAIRDLSGGQKAKVLLLKMSLSGSNVLLLDEPTRNFSPLSNPVIRQILKEYPGAIISISHDRKYIGEVCDVVYELDKDGLHTKLS